MRVVIGHVLVVSCGGVVVLLQDFFCVFLKGFMGITRELSRFLRVFLQRSRSLAFGGLEKH